MTEHEIWQSANKFILVFEDKAVMAAGMCEDIAQGDPEHRRLWEQITAAIIELQRQRALGTEAIH